MLLQLAALLSKFHFSFVEAKFLYVDVWPNKTLSKPFNQTLSNYLFADI